MDTSGEKAARRLVDRVFDRFSELSNEDLRRVALPPRSVPRDIDARVRRAARAAGLTDVLEDARREAVELVLERFGDATYDPTFLGLNWGRSLGPVEDRTAIATALGDAAMAAVVEGHLDDADVERLRSGFEVLSGAALDVPPDGSSAAALGSPSPVVRTVAIILVLFMIGATVGIQLVALVASAGGLLGVGAAIVALVLGLGLWRRRQQTSRATDR